MKRRGKGSEEFVPIFIDTIPEQLKEGRLYVSLRYRTVTHLCACGCGVEVNTPLHPTGWKISYDGIALSLSPSVGNWGEDCRSHYLIERNAVRWSRSWSRGEILDERAARRRDIEEFFDGNTDQEVEADRERGHQTERLPRFLRAVFRLVRRRWSGWFGR